MLQIGVFIPIGNNGWLISSNAPQYKPSFALNKQIAQRAEHYGLDFLLSMIKLRGFGGKTEFWDHNLESFTLMAGLAAVTNKIKLFATAASLVLPPAIVARMAVTIDSIAPGRFGVNLITGWQRPEYSQMGLWPGDEHFANRYQHLTEYAQVLHDLWSTGHCDLDGQYFKMTDCRLSPLPEQGIKIVCAGQSQAGMEFMAQYADYNFCVGDGENTPQGAVGITARMQAAAAKTGRTVESFVMYTIIAAETDAEAQARWQHYKDGADYEALDWMAAQAGADKNSTSDANVRRLQASPEMVNLNFSRLVGSYANVARMLDEMAEMPNVGGVMLVFDDFVQGIEDFGQRIQPLMKSRQHVMAAA